MTLPTTTSSPLSRPRVGILGAGQLALMLAEAAKPLGIDILCAGRDGECAGQVARILPLDDNDPAQVERFAREVDLLTIESENIDARALEHVPVFPNHRAISIAQDRLHEKRFFTECGLPPAPFEPVDSLADLERALERLGTPAILKTRRMGYDGKGQFRLRQPSDAAAAWAELSPDPASPTPCILEGFVAFESEVSLLAARNRAGEIVFWPLIRNHHREGILRVSIAPVLDAGLQRQAERHLRTLMEAMDYVGVLAVEFFVREGSLLGNEMAPRVHNSGHWTIEGSATSQFANHLRAIVGAEHGFALGSTDSRPTVMLNCIGTMPPLEETARFPELFRHDYGKAPRPGRKVGHLTCFAEHTATIAEWERRLNGGETFA